MIRIAQKKHNADKMKKWRKKNIEHARDYSRRYSRQWKIKNPEKSKQIKDNASRKYSYGITKQQYIKMLKNQKNKCKICARLFCHTPHIDHCHETGKIRGLLCMRCNIFLGIIENGLKNLKLFIKYLIKYG